MDHFEERNAETIERLGKQSGFLLNTYQAEMAKDPASSGTESARSNIIALWHTIRQIDGKAVTRGVANLVYANKNGILQPKSVRPTPSFAVTCLRDGR